MKIVAYLVVIVMIIILPSTSRASWQVPVNLGTVVNSDSADGSPSISSDGGVLFFHSDRNGGFGEKDIWISFRGIDGWDWPLNLGSVVNTEYDETNPSISWSGDTLYFSSDRPGGEGGYDIWMSVMESGEWRTPVNLGPVVNSASFESGPEISRNGGKLYFHSDRDGGYGGTDIWCSERVGGSWSSPVNLGTGVNSSSNERNPALGLLSSILYFASDRSGGYGNSDIWASFSEGASWGEAFNLEYRVNGPNSDGGPSISGEGDELYFNSRRSGGSGRSDLWMCSYGPTLVTEEWIARYNGPAGSYDRAHAIALDGGGNVYVTGGSDGSGSSTDYATIKYDTDGDELWVARYDGPAGSYDYAKAIALDQDGNVYVTGYSSRSRTSFDYATIKYDTDGNELWVARYNGPGHGWDLVEAIALDRGGNVYVTGGSVGIGSSDDYATIKYDTNGNELWVARYDGPAGDDDYAKAIALDQDGNVFVTGYSKGSGSYLDYATIKYDTDGNELWTAHYNGPGNGGDGAEAITLDQDGNIFVTGGSSTDYATIKYDTDGNELWVARYDGPAGSSDHANAIALDQDGNVFVTGKSDRSGSYYNYATIKYDTDGNELWVARYDGPGSHSDYAEDIALDSDKNIYVTGGSELSGNSTDYLTIKYIPNPPARRIPGHR